MKKILWFRYKTTIYKCQKSARLMLGSGKKRKLSKKQKGGFLPLASLATSLAPIEVDLITKVSGK